MAPVNVTVVYIVSFLCKVCIATINYYYDLLICFFQVINKMFGLKNVRKWWKIILKAQIDMLLFLF